MKSLYTAAFTLVMVMDPLGNVPVALSILNRVNPKRRIPILLRESLIAFCILAIFLFWGNYILEGLSITQAALRIAGGVILFLIALKMIFPPSQGEQTEAEGEPFIVPLAIPMIAGPSAMATVVLFSTQSPTHLFSLFCALAIAATVSAILLMFGTQLQKLLGDRGLTAIERLMGMLLTTIAVQMFLDGIQDYATSQF